jgi:hypothetical protein
VKTNTLTPLSFIYIHTMFNQSNKKSKGFFFSLLFIGLCTLHIRSDSSIYQTFDCARYSSDTQIELVIEQIDFNNQIHSILNQISDPDHSSSHKKSAPTQEHLKYTIATSLHFNSIVQQILKSNSVLTTGLPYSFYRQAFAFHQSNSDYPNC